jgi:hypothetical protein
MRVFVCVCVCVLMCLHVDRVRVCHGLAYAWIARVSAECLRVLVYASVSVCLRVGASLTDVLVHVSSTDAGARSAGQLPVHFQRALGDCTAMAAAADP